MSKIERGLRESKKIPRYLIWKYREKIKYRNSSLFQNNKDQIFVNCSQDTEYNTLLDSDELNLSDNQKSNFKTYLSLPEVAHSHGCEHVLEIGAGLSTGIWAQYAKRTGAKVTSIDATKNNIQYYYQDTNHISEINNYIDFICGVTISMDSLLEFYERPKSDLAGVSVSEFESDLETFTRCRGSNKVDLKMIADITSKNDWRISDVIISDNSLHFPDEYLRNYIQQDTLDEHAAMLSQNKNVGVLDDLINSGNSWDLVWFDSGEVSSMVEWEKISDSIRSGGLAAFHDIFSLKSMKNFVIAASILNDPNWTTLCVDNRTMQGIMIAQKS
jgi:predicted O-methyltransferase YrrM